MKVILYDGDCTFCNFWVKTALRYDKRKRLFFAPLKSPLPIALPKVDAGVDSVVFIDGERVYYASTAALQIARCLDGLWPLLAALLIIPATVRDRVYHWVARSRFLFGKSTTCLLPDPDLITRFNLNK